MEAFDISLFVYYAKQGNPTPAGTVAVKKRIQRDSVAGGEGAYRKGWNAVPEYVTRPCLWAESSQVDHDSQTLPIMADLVWNRDDLSMKGGMLSDNCLGDPFFVLHTGQ